MKLLRLYIDMLTVHQNNLLQLIDVRISRISELRKEYLQSSIGRAIVSAEISQLKSEIRIIRSKI